MKIQGLGIKCLNISPKREVTMHVIINLASEQPLPKCHGNHLCSNRRGRKYTEDISTVSLVEQGVAIEVYRVKIYVISNTKKMPSHLAAETHFQYWQVSKNKTIYCWGTKNNRVKLLSIYSGIHLIQHTLLYHCILTKRHTKKM